MSNDMKITEELKIITEDIIKVIKLHQITSRELYKNAEWDDFLEYQKEAAQEDVLYDVDIDQTKSMKDLSALSATFLKSATVPCMSQRKKKRRPVLQRPKLVIRQHLKKYMKTQ